MLLLSIPLGYCEAMTESYMYICVNDDKINHENKNVLVGFFPSRMTSLKLAVILDPRIENTSESQTYVCYTPFHYKVNHPVTVQRSCNKQFFSEASKFVTTTLRTCFRTTETILKLNLICMTFTPLVPQLA